MGEARVHSLVRDRAVGLPTAVVDLLQRASTALDAQDWRAAALALSAALTAEPECAEALRMHGLVLHLRGDFAGAVALLQQADALKPGDALIEMNLATSRYANGECAAALAGLQRACATTQDFAPAWYNLGKMYLLQERPAGAVTALHRTLDLEPGHVPARMLLAQAEASLGATLQAAENYREVLRLEPDEPGAWLGLADLDDAHFCADDVARLQHALQVPQVQSHARVCFGFALTRALEDQGDYGQAYRALRKANTLMHRQLSWNSRQATAMAEGMRQTFAQPLASAIDATQGADLIFVVGMPQAGSLLTAEILASHPQVSVSDGPNTLEQVIDAESVRRQRSYEQWMAAATSRDWQRLGQDYLARVEPMRAHGSRLVERTPSNWRLVGVINAMLPGAHVVNSRRGALETCFACYHQLFVTGHEFSYDLEHVASYWSDYDRLCRHWRRTFPASFLDHDYEAWQSDPAPQVRRLLDFCGLSFDPACVDFHRTQRVERAASSMAAGELMRRDSLRCAAYGDQLDRLRALLRVRVAAE
ncbi:MAG: sulfotransferase [Rhodanobacter sp.]